MRKLSPVFVGLLIFIVLFMVSEVEPFVFAHGTNYLEFNPDQSSSLKVVDVATPSQVFFAQNDFLGGLDIWVANPGSAGTATFALLNAGGSVLSSKNVSISYIFVIAIAIILIISDNNE